LAGEGEGQRGGVRLLRNPGCWAFRPDVAIDVATPAAGATVVTVGGELDLASVPQLRACLADLVKRGQVDIVLDLSGVSFCDSTALGVFVGTNRRVTAAGGHIEFREPRAALRNLLVVSGLDQILHIS